MAARPRLWTLSLAAALALPAAAGAGAWLQEEGRAFVSVSYEVTTPRAALSEEALAVDPTPPLSGFRSVWAEYGLLQWLTVGIDAGQPDEDTDSWEGVVFGRVPLARQEGATRIALQAGIGQRRYVAEGPFFGADTRETEPIARLWLLLGHGFSGLANGGWLAADGQYEWRFDTAEAATKLDLTAGLRVTERHAVILQSQNGDYPGGPAYSKLLAGVVWGLPWNLSLETSVIAGLRTDESIGGKVGLWWRF